MGDKLEKICESLTIIKSYLVKVGPDRRRGEQAIKRCEDANDLFIQYKKCIAFINQQIGKSELLDHDIKEIKVLNSSINEIYKYILSLTPTDTGTNTETLSAFDIKVACNLLFVMDNTEDQTEKLIDAIELYETMLNDEGKAVLINFVLKTRLTKNVKLRLSSACVTVTSLIDDMKKHLLTQKSDSAILSKLSVAEQGNRSIENFGKELEELFVNLTISQAKGDSNAFNILKPINERNAVKNFADGLKNQRLSTIIAASNFVSLKEAIRAAQDEESVQSDNSQLMSFSSRGRYNNRNNRVRTNYSNLGNRNFHARRNPTRSAASYSSPNNRGNRGNRENIYNQGRSRHYYYNSNRGNRSARSTNNNRIY